MWEHGALRERRGEGPIYAAVYEEGGAARGYALYTVRDGVYGPTSEERHPDESQRLTLRELVALSPAAYEALWRVVGSHDLVRRIHYANVPEDDPLFDLVQEPRLLRRWTQDGIMARVVDVAAGLPQRPYGGPLSLRLRVIDPLCPWNDGVWSMETDGAQTTVDAQRWRPGADAARAVAGGAGDGLPRRRRAGRHGAGRGVGGARPGRRRSGLRDAASPALLPPLLAAAPGALTPDGARPSSRCWNDLAGGSFPL